MSDLAPPPFDPAVIEDLLRQLDKTVRAHQLYPSHNPTYLKTVDLLRAAFVRTWAETDTLVLEVSDTDFVWAGVPVLKEPEKVSDSLPWTLFKDGVRQLILTPGFEGDELATLLDIIPKVRRAQDHEDDILTLLWEAEFAFLKYSFVDNVTGDGVPLDPSATPGRWPATPDLPREDPTAAVADAKRRMRERGAAVGGKLDSMLAVEKPAAEVPVEPLKHSGAQMSYLAREIDREYAADVRRAALDVLLDIFELQDDSAVRAEVVQHLDGLSLHLLTSLDFAAVTHLLRESAVVLGRTSSLTPEVRTSLEKLADRVSDPVVLAPLLEALDAAEVPPSTEDFTAFVDRLGPRALGTLFVWSAQARLPVTRALLGAAADRLSMTGLDELVKLIGSADQRESLEATRRAGAMRIDAAVLPLVRLLGNSEEDLRAAALSALLEIGSPRALSGAERAIDDASGKLRMIAIRAITAAAHKPALGRVTEAVTGRGVREMDANERQALFELYGTLCGDAGVPWLDSQLVGAKGFFKRKSDPELRACCATALGKIGTEKAREVLSRALDEKDPLIRRAVARALAPQKGAP